MGCLCMYVIVCVQTLPRMIDKHGGEINEAVFEEFDFRRRPNAWAIQNMALENFHEMQSRVADPFFLLVKGIENRLELECPELYRSRYAMVCYGGLGNVSYAGAYRLGKLQEDIRKDLAKGIKTPEELDLEKAKKVLRERLLPVQKKMKVRLTYTYTQHTRLHTHTPLSDRPDDCESRVLERGGAALEAVRPRAALAVLVLALSSVRVGVAPSTTGGDSHHRLDLLRRVLTYVAANDAPLPWGARATVRLM